MAVEEQKTITAAEKAQALTDGKSVVQVSGKGWQIKAASNNVVLVKP